MADQLNEQQRRALGKQGKLWRIEMTGKVGAEVRNHELLNLTGAEVQQFRRDVYSIGIMLPIDPGHWVMIHPADILTIHIWKQNDFFTT